VRPPVEALADLREHREERLSVVVAPVDVFPAVTARGDVVERSGKLDATLPRPLPAVPGRAYLYE
jgi:hypothetical protein